MSLNVSEQECNGGKKYGQKGTLCGPNIPPNLKRCMSSGNFTLNQTLNTDSERASYSSGSYGRYCLLAL
jgi:hypothetical protein